jgi:hypothetical protein
MTAVKKSYNIGPWCTNKPLPDLVLSVSNETVNQLITSACPDGKRAIGCSYKPRDDRMLHKLLYSSGYVCACFDYQVLIS